MYIHQYPYGQDRETLDSILNNVMYMYMYITSHPHPAELLLASHHSYVHACNDFTEFDQCYKDHLMRFIVKIVN